MPGEAIDRPNPKPLDSQIPDSVNSLAVNLETLHISEDDLQALQAFRRASNYIAAGKHYPPENPLYLYVPREDVYCSLDA